MWFLKKVLEDRDLEKVLYLQAPTYDRAQLGFDGPSIRVGPLVFDYYLSRLRIVRTVSLSASVPHADYAGGMSSRRTNSKRKTLNRAFIRFLSFKERIWYSEYRIIFYLLLTILTQFLLYLKGIFLLRTRVWSPHRTVLFTISIPDKSPQMHHTNPLTRTTINLPQ